VEGLKEGRGGRGRWRPRERGGRTEGEAGKRDGGEEVPVAGRETLRRALLRVGVGKDFASLPVRSPILRVSEVRSSETEAAQFAHARGSRGIRLPFPINDSRRIQTAELEAQF
jgi:hypothetical protein